MHWVEGGVVRIPLRHVYLCAIVLAMAYFLAREISMTHKRRRQAGCLGFQEDLRRREAQAGPDDTGFRDSLVTRKRSLREAKEEEEEQREDEDSDESEAAGEQVVCRGKPIQTDTVFCPDCLRSRVNKLSEKLQRISYSPLMFPRGPPDLFKLRNHRQQSFVQEYLITPWAVCSPTRRCPYLLAVQTRDVAVNLIHGVYSFSKLSVAEDVDRRRAVRTTWGSVAKTQQWPNTILNGEVQLLFVLGHQVSSIESGDGPADSKPGSQGETHRKRQWSQLQAEAATHGDLLFIDMQDSYFNLTLKLMSAFKWVHHHCISVKFVLKVDTDTFVNIPLLVDLLILNEDRLKFSVLGTIYTQERAVHRRHKWALNATLYPPPVYPIYASGCSYVLSASALGQMVDTAPYVSPDHLSTFLGADFFATGRMGGVLSFDFFDVPDLQLFGLCNSTQWNPCDMIEDNRVFGTVRHGPGGDLGRQLKLWRLFYRYYHHYR